MILCTAGLFFTLAGIPPVHATTFRNVNISSVKFNTGSYERPARSVAGILVLPKKTAGNKLPGLVFCHGMLVQKEMYIAQCRELALRGFAVLAIDLRGHGQTGGSYSFGSTEMIDVWAAVDYLSRLNVVDAEKIAVAGHSLGGITATRAGLFQKGGRIKTVIAVYCWPSQKDAIEEVFGKIPDFIGRIWQYYGLSRVYDINDSRALQERNVINHITRLNPPNYQLIIGKWDMLGTVNQAKKILTKATGVKNPIPGKIYGEFRNGSARRLVITTDTHLTEAVSSEVMYALCEWLFLSFGLKPPDYFMSHAIYRYIGWSMVSTGFALIAFGFLFFAHAILSAKNLLRKSERFSERNASVRASIIAALLFLAVSIASFPFSRFSGIRAFLPFFGIDLFASLALSRSILLIPAYAVLGLFTAQRKIKPLQNEVPNEERDNLKKSLTEILISLFIGALPIAVFIALYAPAAHALLLPGAIPVSAGWFFAVAAVIAFQLWIEQKYFYSFLLGDVRKLSARREFWKYALIEGAIRGLGLGICFLPVVSNPFMLIGHSDSIFRFPLVALIFISGFITYALIGALALFSRSRGYSLIAPSLGIAMYLALLFTSVISTRAF